MSKTGRLLISTSAVIFALLGIWLYASSPAGQAASQSSGQVVVKKEIINQPVDAYSEQDDDDEEDL